VGSYNYTSLGEEKPNAPLITVELASLDKTKPKKVNWRAFLDTGSDITLVPLDALVQISAKVARTPNVYGVGGKKTTVYAYYVAFTMDNHTLPLVPVYGCPIDATGGYILVGRDLLNQYCIQFDGLNQTFSFIY